MQEPTPGRSPRTEAECTGKNSRSKAHVSSPALVLGFGFAVFSASVLSAGCPGPTPGADAGPPGDPVLDAGFVPGPENDAGIDAGSPEPEPVPPDSPVGAQLAWLIGAINNNRLSPSELEPHFSDAFQAAVPLADLSAVLQDYSQTGAPWVLLGFTDAPTEFSLEAEIETQVEFLRIPLQVEPTPPHRITGIFLSPAPDLDPTLPTTWAGLAEELQASAPTTSLFGASLDAAGNCSSLYAAETSQDAPADDVAMALGSVFKLYILSELADRVADASVSYDDLLAIDADLKSLPSGTFQDQPAGMEFTLLRYAEEMISVSDNTATDHLLFHLGRPAVEAAVTSSGHHDPMLLTPFLSTRELFVLKLLVPALEVDNYLSLDSEGQRSFLNDVVPTYDLAAVDSVTWGPPRRIEELEWFATAQDICRLMGRLKVQGDSDVNVTNTLAINPGLSLNRTTWPYVGYKGGSEPGVLVYSFLLQRSDGGWFFLFVGVNDPLAEVDSIVATRAAVGASQVLGAP